MNRRPHSVTAICCLFLAAGLVGLIYHAGEVTKQNPFRNDMIWVLLVRLVAIVCAVFMFRGSNWARWVLLIWMGCHVILSALHSPLQLIVHSLLLAVMAYVLFRRPAAEYFRGATAQCANK